MVKQYPHIATIILTTDGGRDDKGYPLPPDESIITLVCRAEPNSSNAIIYTQDGAAYNYKYVVYIQKGQSDVPVGSRVTQIADPSTGQIIFTDDGQSINTQNNFSLVTNSGLLPSSNNIVKRYSNGQLNTRIWL